MMEDRSVLTRVGPAPDVTTSYGPDADQRVEVWLGDARAERRPLVALIHGGFWRPQYDRVHLRPMAAALRELGWTTVSVEYRRVPGRPDVATDDVRAALAAVPALRPHNGLVVVAGHSAGGHLALWAAAVAPAPGLLATVGLAPVADLELAHRLGLGSGAVSDFLGDVPSARPELDPARLDTPATPVVIVQGDADESVPIEVARRYVAAHPSTRLVRVAAAGHFALIDPLSAAWSQVCAELARVAP